MTNRERFRRTLLFQKADRAPYFEEGIRTEVLKAWKTSKKRLQKLFPTDPRDEIQIDLEPHPALPALEIDLKKFNRYYNPERKSRFPRDWKRQIVNWQFNDHIRLLRVHRGFFLAMGVYHWHQFEQVITLTMENPAYVQNYLMHYTHFCAAITEKILDRVSIDAVIFSEPIGGKEGPLLSPSLYSSLVLPTYKPLFKLLHARGIRNIIFRTYANAAVLLPAIIDFGFTCLWACEPDIEDMDYRRIRDLYGNKLSLIGGINIETLRAGRTHIREELTKKIPVLLHTGGFIPLSDGRIRADIPFEDYCFYREMLNELIQSEEQTIVYD